MDEQKEKLISSVSQVFTLFLLVLIVFFGVKTANEFRQGRYIGQDIESRNTINVSASGEVFVKPNLAVTTVSVTTEKKTVAEALADNTAKMNGVISFIKGQGVEEKDLKTTAFNIYPQYEYRQPDIYGRYPPGGQRILVGYEVDQSLQVKIRDLTKIGDIIQGATDQGANQVGALQFTLDPEEEEKAKDEARKEAIDQAKAKASVLASQLGVKLVRISSFSESGVYPALYKMDQAAYGMGGAGVEAAPQVQSGENMITISVNIVYEID